MGNERLYRSNWSHAKYFKTDKSHHILLILLVFLSDSDQGWVCDRWQTLSSSANCWRNTWTSLLDAYMKAITTIAITNTCHIWASRMHVIDRTVDDVLSQSDPLSFQTVSFTSTTCAIKRTSVVIFSCLSLSESSQISKDTHMWLDQMLSYFNPESQPPSLPENVHRHTTHFHTNTHLIWLLQMPPLLHVQW